MPVKATMSSRAYRRISVSPKNMEELAVKFGTTTKTVRLALRYDPTKGKGVNETYEIIRKEAIENYFGAWVDDVAVTWQENPEYI